MSGASTAAAHGGAGHTLVVSRSRGWALVRLAIWFAIVGGFYGVLLGRTGSSTPTDGARGLLLLVPLFLAPYLVDALRVLLRGERLVFDRAARELRGAGGFPIPFDDIGQVELSAVNGGCEELALRLRLRDGRVIPVSTGTASARIETLASRVAAAVGVAVVRNG